MPSGYRDLNAGLDFGENAASSKSNERQDVSCAALACLIWLMPVF